MFFIGGINSVLPYILYLSLVWIFIFIGQAHLLKDVLQQSELPLHEIQANEAYGPGPALLLATGQEIKSSVTSHNRAKWIRPPGYTDTCYLLVMQYLPPPGTERFISYCTSIYRYRGPPLS